MSAQADSQKSVLFALGANLGIALGKSVAAFFTHSGSMLAEAIHSFADCTNQLLLLWGMKQAKKPPDEDFPMGHGNLIFFWSFVVALMLFTVGGLFSIHAGISKLQQPEPLEKPWIAIVILGFSVVLECFSLYGALREIKKDLRGRSLLRWFKDSRQAALVVVFGEDVAALLGLGLAFLAVLTTVLTGNPMWDALGSIGVGVLLVVVAWFVGRETKALLVGQSAEAPVREGIARVVAAQGGVQKVLNIITLHFGDDLMVAVKAELRDYSNNSALCAAINDAEAAIKREYPAVKWVFFEPDVK